MKSLLLLLFSSLALAGPGDLKVLQTLMRVGVSTKPLITRLQIDVEGVECSRVHRSGRTQCTLKDLASGSVLNLFGEDASLVMEILIQKGAQVDEAAGKIYSGARAIHCTSAKEKSDCTFKL